MKNAYVCFLPQRFYSTDCYRKTIFQNSHQLVAEHTLAGGPLESGHNRVFDFVQVLDSLGHVEQQIGASAVRAEAPDLSRLRHVVLVLLCQHLCTSLQNTSKISQLVGVCEKKNY